MQMLKSSRRLHQEQVENTEQIENTKSTEREKLSFPKDPVEYTDLSKPILNRIMTTHE